MAGRPVTATPSVNDMARRRTQRVLVRRVTAAGSTRRPDTLIVEEPMTIQLDGTVVSTTMRTPGHDFELAVGFCFTEGLLAGLPVTGVRYCAPLEVRQGGRGSAMESEFNVVTVETGGRSPVPTARLVTTSSSCGWCGSAQLDEMLARLSPLPAPAAPIPLDTLAAMPARVLDGQGLFASTGAVHAAAAFDGAGDVLVSREDVGRHNAVDKVVGALVLAGGVPSLDPSLAALGLFVSGRASIEIVHKAWAAGFSALVAVSAPTSLAVDAARRAGMTLVGFVRDDGFNVYS
jgi:FdhD protein